MMTLLKSLPVVLILFHIVCGWNYGGGGHHDIPHKIIIKHVPKHVPVYKPVPIPKLVPVPKPVGYLKPLSIAKPFKVPQVIPVIKHLQKPFPVLKGVPFHFPIPLPKLVKLPFQIKIPKPYVVRVPKPYAVAKKYPVAVPVHIPKPYVVPILKSVPVGVPQKIPKIVPVVKEVPEYVKRPVPVYIEEQPYKPNYKGTPYPSGDYKGTPYTGGDYKGTPYQGGDYKGSPLPGKGTPYPQGGHKGKGGGGGQSSIINPTSAASFLATHAGKLQSHPDGQSHIYGAYTQNHAFSGLQGLGGGIHGGYHGAHWGSDVQGYGGSWGFEGNQNPYASGAQDHGHYIPGDIDGSGVYGRDTTKEQVVSESTKYGQDNGAGGISYDQNHFASDQVEGQQNEGYGSENPQTYLGVSVSNFNDHSGRGEQYQGEQSTGGYNVGENKITSDFQGENTGTHYGNNGQVPTLAIYQLQNGAATPINYPQANANYYNTGYQSHSNNNYQGDGNEDQGYDNQAPPYAGYESQIYSQNENTDAVNNGPPQQQSSYGYQSQDNSYASYQQSGKEYPSPQSDAGYQPSQQSDTPHPSFQNDEPTQDEDSPSQQDQNNYGSQSSTYENQGSYGSHGSSKVYHNQASYYINHGNTEVQGNDASHQDVVASLQNYGLKAAYATQPGKENGRVEGATGTVYMRAYDQAGNPVYNVQNSVNFQAQETQPRDTYSDYSQTKPEEEQAEKQEPLIAKARSYESDQLVGDSNGYSTQEGGDIKGGSWNAA
ncbi:hornerin-like [Parasteatoda tepidariorum]|uniref:hornerin-like n=1 Tax=Parasteatoda tepidariorum TaxID=114398 RepID=UPI001C718EE8|nr:filaggrin-2-like [Parasteatoda tepidariorum]